MYYNAELIVVETLCKDGNCSLDLEEANAMDLNTMKERFSLAYIGAVASQAGFHVDEPTVDRDSVDGVLRGDTGRRPRIEFQAKATSQNVLRESHLAFPLPITNYNQLRINSILPRILIVVLMPVEETQWLKQTTDELCLRHCAYWLSLEGRPSVANRSTVTVRIPLANMFNGDQLSDLMERTERENSL